MASSESSVSLKEEAGRDALLPVLTMLESSIASPPKPSTPALELRSLCKKGETGNVQSFLDNLGESDKADVLNAVSEEGWTSLHEIITHECQFTEVARILMEAGAEVNTLDANGDSPLHSALLYHNVDNVQLLLKHGADPNAANAAGRLAIHLADDTDTLKLLIEGKADLNAVDMNGNAALHYAVVARDLERVLLLLETADKVELNKKNNNGCTPLHLASDPNVALALLQSGADHTLVDKVGNTPLHIAVRRRHKELVKTLLSFNACPAAMNKHRKTPVAMARDREMRNLLWSSKITSLAPALNSKSTECNDLEKVEGNSVSKTGNENANSEVANNSDADTNGIDSEQSGQNVEIRKGSQSDQTASGAKVDGLDNNNDNNEKDSRMQNSMSNNCSRENDGEEPIMTAQISRSSSPCNSCNSQDDVENIFKKGGTSSDSAKLDVSSSNETDDQSIISRSPDNQRPEQSTTAKTPRPMKRPSSVLSSSFIVISSNESPAVNGILKRSRTEPRPMKRVGPRLRFSEVNDYSGVEVVQEEAKRVKVAPLYTEPTFSSEEEDDDDDEDYCYNQTSI